VARRADAGNSDAILESTPTAGKQISTEGTTLTC